MTPAAPPWTLGRALHRFSQAPSVRILGSLVLGLSGLRLWLGLRLYTTTRTSAAGSA